MNHQPASEAEFLTLSDVQALLQELGLPSSRPTIDKLAREEHLPMFRVGGRRFAKRANLLAWIDSRVEGARSHAA